MRRALAAALLPAAALGVSCTRAPAPPRASAAIAVPYELGTLDPHAEDKLGNEAILFNLYEPLVRTDAEMRIRPALAVAWESPDPLTWVFHLRGGVRFHDGRLLGAADVVSSFRRPLDDPSLEIRNYLVDVAEVSALDEATVRIRTRAPTRVLLSRLSYVAIVPRGARGEALRGSADGTGPYTLAGWDAGRSVRLVRNRRYWGAAPVIGDVLFDLAQSPERAMAGLLAGRYQLVRADSRKVVAQAEGSERLVALRRDNLFAKYMAFDLARDATPFCGVRPNPFKDARVRRALNLGIDRHGLVKELWNYAVPATQPVPRMVFGFAPEIAEPGYDPGAARELLRRAGLGGGFEVALHARTVMAEAAELVSKDLSRIGIRGEVRVLPDAEFFDLVGGRGASLWLNRFGCLTGDATELLLDMIHTADPARHMGSINYTGFSDPGLDAAIEAVSRLEKVEDRKAEIQALMRQVMDRLLVIPLYNDQDVYALDRSLEWEPRSDSYILAAEIGRR